MAGQILEQLLVQADQDEQLLQGIVVSFWRAPGCH
jgi:hypothetical protein